MKNIYLCQRAEYKGRLKVVDLFKPYALHVEIAKESLDSAVCWRLIKVWCLRIVIIIAIGNCYRYGSFLCEGLDRCWLINTGLEREDCTACGVTGRVKDWDLPPKYEPRLAWSCR